MLHFSLYTCDVSIHLHVTFQSTYMLHFSPHTCYISVCIHVMYQSAYMLHISLYTCYISVCMHVKFQSTYMLHCSLHTLHFSLHACWCFSLHTFYISFYIQGNVSVCNQHTYVTYPVYMILC
jgi:hypothetical protein